MQNVLYHLENALDQISLVCVRVIVCESVGVMYLCVLCMCVVGVCVYVRLFVCGIYAVCANIVPFLVCCCRVQADG